MNTLQVLHCDETITYDGSQLSPHWIYKRFDLMGDSLVSFHGPAQLTLNEMVDLEDIKQQAPIFSPQMVHFIGEWFTEDLYRAILWQHLFVCEVYEYLLEHGIAGLTRKGNDIYFEKRKLNVSIATKSSLSVLMHCGINIRTENTPIPTSGLEELKISPNKFAVDLLERFKTEFQGWERARAKVLPR